MQSLVDSCKLNTQDFNFFQDVATKNNMSGRAIMRVLSVARTIADMQEKINVEHSHLCEALTFRVRDKSGIEIDKIC